MKYFPLLILLYIANITCVFGQTFNESDFEALKFRNIGPAGMSGRVTAIDVDLSNSNRIFVGTASGGVWLSENGGTSWSPLFDKNDCLSIGSVKINQRNPAEIWVGTGEGNPRNSLNTGRGIYKSIDGGKSWKNMGLENTKTIHRIIIDTHNPNTVYAGALGSPWGPNKERGLFKTTDGGKTWKNILYVNDETGAADMVVDPNNPNKILVAMWEHSRKPWFFNSGGKGSGLYLTYDGGENWKKITDKEGMPKGDLGRIGIAFAPSKTNIIYALVEAEANGLYKSTDGGEKWSLVSDTNIGNRPFYYSELYVDPKNENRIFNIFTYVSKSEDGGRTFEDIMNYGNDIHPDHHAFWIHPEDPNYMIGGSDGGMTISRDGGSNWTFVNNLPVGQFYHINIDNDFPYNIYGGMQDNGSWVGPSSVLKRGGIRNNDFREISFGDGFDVVPFRKDSRYGYSMSQQGYVGFYDRQTGYSRSVRPLSPDTTELRFNWNTGIAQDPFDDCGVYFGSQFLHHSSDCGESWNIISPDLTTNDPAKQKSGESGGLTYDATGAENHTTILSIAPSNYDKKTIYVGTDDGRLQITRDGGVTWNDHYNKLRGAPKGGWINQIELSKHNDGEAFVIVNNYRQNDYSAYIYYTKDFGNSWTSLVTSDLKNFTLSIIQDPKEENLLFLGSDDGLYFSIDKGKKWHHFTKNFPQVQVSDLKIQERENDLVIGTFGRSIWVLDDIEVFRAITRESNLLSKGFVLFNASPAYDVSYRSVDGIRFKAQGEFTGDNDNIGRATFNYWKKPIVKDDAKAKTKKTEDEKGMEDEDEGKSDKKSKDKIYVTILDSKRDTVRNFSLKSKDGYNQFTWGYESNGVNYPSKKEKKEDDDSDPSRGVDVMPGVYLVIAQLDGATDSTIVQIQPDLRRNMTLGQIEAKTKALKDLERLISTATESFNLVKSARSSIKKTESLLEGQPDSIKTQFKDIHKKFKTQLDSIETVFFGEEVKKGIKRSKTSLTDKIWSARSYINSSTDTPKGTALIAIQKAKEAIETMVPTVNDFFGEEWNDYKIKVESIKPIIFKEIEKIEIKK